MSFYHNQPPAHWQKSFREEKKVDFIENHLLVAYGEIHIHVQASSVRRAGVTGKHITAIIHHTKHFSDLCAHHLPLA